jgi:hypothetical protein
MKTTNEKINQILRNFDNANVMSKNKSAQSLGHPRAKQIIVCNEEILMLAKYTTAERKNTTTYIAILIINLFDVVFVSFFFVIELILV